MTDSTGASRPGSPGASTSQPVRERPAGDGWDRDSDGQHVAVHSEHGEHDEGPAPGPPRRIVHVAPAKDRVRTFPIAWWGMIMMIVTEAMIFAGLLASYFYLQAINSEWPPGHIETPHLPRAIIFTVVLLGSSIPVMYAERGGRRGNIPAIRRGLFVAFVLGLAFSINQALEYRELGFGIRDNAYTSMFYEITGLHGLHVIIGLLMSLMVQAKAWTGRVTFEHHVSLRVFGMYWHFVDAVWIFVFFSLYVSPHFGSG